MGNRPGQRLVRPVVHLELVSLQPGEPTEHLPKHLGLKTRVLLCGLPKEIYKSVAGFKDSEVNEVTCFGAAEDGEYLVDGEFLAAQDQPMGSLLSWEKASIRSKIDDRLLAFSVHDQPGEAMSDLAPFHA